MALIFAECIPGTAPVSSSSATLPSSSVPIASTTANPLPTSTSFVKTSGQKFTLDGEDYVVAGTNAYWLAQVSDADIDTAFDDIVNSKLTTVRTMQVYISINFCRII